MQKYNITRRLTHDICHLTSIYLRVIRGKAELNISFLPTDVVFLNYA